LLNSATLGTQGVVVTAQVYTLSFQGTGTITKSGAATGVLAGTGAAQRVSQTFTPTAGTLTCTVTGSVTNAQLEAQPYLTSYIPTTGAAATRAADALQYYPLPLGYNAATYSLFAEFDTVKVGGVVCGIANTFSDASYIANSGWVVSGASSAPVGIPAIAVGAITRQCVSLSPTTLAISNNGGSPVTGGNGAPAQTAAVRLSVGSSPWSLDNSIVGHMRRIRYWPRALSNTELQAVTS
jgi:hypothetical protein